MAVYFVRKEVANAYDSYISESIPYYAATLECIADAIAARVGADGIYADLGCGTGNVSVAVANRIRVSSCSLIDVSSAMLEIATLKLEQLSPPPQVRCITADFAAALRELEQAHFDAVTAVLTLDHVCSDGDLRSLFLQVRTTLKPGGVFIIAEKCADGANKRSESWRSFARMIHIRAQHMRDKKLKVEADVESWLTHIFEEDHLRSLRDLWSIAEDSGFEVEDCSGVELPHEDALTMDVFFGGLRMRALSRADVFSSEAAHAIGLLVLRKPWRYSDGDKYE